MPKLNPLTLLIKTVDKLKAERAELATRIAEIDSLFAKISGGSMPAVAAVTGARRGRPVGSKNVAKSGRKPRGSFSKTGEESVFDFIKSHGKPNAAEINAHWSGEGRGGKADNTIGKLVKDGKVKRVEVKGERGARYTAA